MSLQPPEVLNRIAQLRAKMTDDPKSVTPEDLTEAMQLLRANRMKSSEAARKSKSKSKSPPRSADELLSDI